MQGAHFGAVLLERVVESLAIDAPVRRFDSRADPVRIGHGLVESDGLRGRGKE